MEFIRYDLDSECGRYCFLPLEIQINSKKPGLELTKNWLRT